MAYSAFTGIFASCGIPVKNNKSCVIKHHAVTFVTQERELPLPKTQPPKRETTMTSHETLTKFAQHYRDDARIIRSARGTNLTAFNLGHFHIEASNSDDNPNIFCDLYHHYTLITSINSGDLQELHTTIDYTINSLKEDIA